MLHHDADYKGLRSALEPFYKNNKCARTTIRRFRTLKSIKSDPIISNGLQKMTAEFEKSGSSRERETVSAAAVQDVASA